MHTNNTILFECEYSIECNARCQEELCCMPDGPKHVFNNLLDFAEPRYRKSLGLDGGRQLSNAELAKTIPYMRIKKKTWCVKCGQDCALPVVDEHDAGPHCTDHSSMGANAKDDGPKAKFLYIWVAIIRNTKPKRIYQENVRSYGDARM
eukprot:598081-Karenia_brevis.AAC.1